MQIKTRPLLVSLAVAAVVASPLASGNGRYNRVSIPSVVVTLQNQAVQRGGFQTPVWGGIHDGSFDLYDRNVALGDIGVNPDLISRESVERIAEDGITGPITEEFDALQPGSAQATFVAPGGPLQPGARVSKTLNVEQPYIDRYFSYASMVIPSNDAFVANGNPLAHELFDNRGRFVGEDFIVAGSEVLDAGTEVNDEVAGNTAFLNQAAPDTGIDESGVITLSPGFAEAGALNYPNGVLNHPVFANAQFTVPGARTLQFGFRYVDLGGRVRLRAALSPEQEVAPEVVDSRARGSAVLVARDGNRISVSARFNNLRGAPVMAHLHLGQAGVNGPVVVDLGAGLRGNRLSFTIDADDVTGPLADAEEPLLALLNELAAGNIYVNVHTAAFPAGELRGQVALR